MSVKLVKQILPCLKAGDSIYMEGLNDGVREQLAEHRDRLAARAACFLASSRAIEDYLDRVGVLVEADLEAEAKADFASALS